MLTRKDKPRLPASLSTVRGRMLFVYLLAVVIAVGFMVSLLEFRAYQRDIDELQRHMAEVRGQVSVLLAGPVREGDSEQIHGFARFLINDPDLMSLEVFDAQGRASARVGAVDMSPARGWLRVTDPLHAVEEGRIERAGKVVMTFTDRRIWGAFRERVLGNLLLVVTLALTMLLVTALVTRQLIDKPLARLLRSLRRIRDEGIKEPVTWDSQDEFGEVVAAYNSMLGATLAAEGVQSRLIQLGIRLTAERDPGELLAAIQSAAMDITGADGCTIYLLEGDHLNFAMARNISLNIALDPSSDAATGFRPLPLLDDDGEPARGSLATLTFHDGRPIKVDDVSLDTERPLNEVRAFDERTGYLTRSILTVPMINRGGDCVGVVQLVNARDEHDGGLTAFRADHVPLLEALASQAAVALETTTLVEDQKALLDAIIELLAAAIDSKSPHTGGHCARVPEAARLLAEAVCDTNSGVFADFGMTEKDWEAFRIASWLHDCGKITTPEYVVEKATKLETIHNRLHEVRTRFEVLRRDAEIRYLRGVADGGDVAELEAARDSEIATLDDEFAFVARLNVGGESLGATDLLRLREIAKRTWVRHFDDRIGLSEDETRARATFPSASPPVREFLLADKPEHVVARREERNGGPFGANPHGFRMDVPEHLYNRGEVHNLSIQRGTLTEEERFKINDHIIQTIIMLNALPWPRHLEDVPEMAGGHHERMDGAGFPKGLTREQMSVPARIMAIADIFEALTAKDRPYKKAKPLSETIEIMVAMCEGGHIDPDLFELFMADGVFMRYADTFLPPGQIDSVDLDAVLARIAACRTAPEGG
ncbi:MAG: HD-GYP domain-containing protein [Gammaproteobacteria bacterium]